MSQDSSMQMVEASKSSKPRIQWCTSFVYLFCDICIEAINKGFRPSTHLNPQGWTWVVSEFVKQSGDKSYDKTKLKNKWDAMKAEHKQWNELVKKETGLGWNSELGTVEASEEWWEEKIKENPGYKNFKKKGVGPDLVAKWDIMFGSMAATGSKAYNTFAIVRVETNYVEYMHVDEYMPHLPGDAVADEYNVFDDPLPSNFGQQPVVEHEQPPQAKKTKKKHAKNKGKAVEDTEDENLAIIAKTLSNKYTASASFYGLSHSSIQLTELGIVLSNIEELHANPDLLYWSLDFLMDHERRTIFQGLPSNEMKYGWLKFMYEREKSCHVQIVKKK